MQIALKNDGKKWKKFHKKKQIYIKKAFYGLFNILINN